jgi:5-methylcytosine-specific restriction endonuclease McrA
MAKNWRERLLDEKVIPFLLTTRVGIDFGETKGGISIESGRIENGKFVNEIRHAEVFCDFHATDLETRRGLRRGRRSRHQKELRLARLRSWVLRQPDASRISSLSDAKETHVTKDALLPDPYPLMCDPAFQCQPGEFETKVGLQKKRALPTWPSAVASGEFYGADPAKAFVVALTHIFQKRGYSYSDADLAALIDAELEDFLGSAALKRSPQRFKELVEKQVVRREIADEEKDFDKRWRGKQIVRGLDLRKLFEQAVAREPAKRKAVHRREKVQQLCQVIEGFINYGTRMSDDEKKTIIQKWQRELAGELDQDVDPRKNPSGLLNKVIRAPRFENRVKSGCAWCGRTCARRSKNRRIAYLAAVNNLSVCEIPPYRQNLTSAQKAQLLTVWRAGEHNPAEARQKFLGRCRHFGISREKQNEIAKLFENWDANGAAAEAKIDKLKANVGGRKPRKLTPAEREKFGLLWTGELQRDVTQDGAFWKSLHKRVAEIFDEFRKSGHPIFKEEMKKQLVDLLTVEPKGRHRLCSACLEKAARGETMFDQGIEPWTLKSRGAPNPCREQHQRRLLNRLAYLLFRARRADGSLVVPEPEKIKYITLEIPKPENKNAPKKGEQRKTERRTPKALLHEETLGRCIYCETEIAVTDVREEHIFPRAQGGPDIREANVVCSCHPCNDTKGNRVPWEWRESLRPSWDEFERRVRESTRLGARKKDILLLGSFGGRIEKVPSFEKLGIPFGELSDEQRAEFALVANWKSGDPFPSDPTALARVGAMPRQFIAGIREIFADENKKRVARGLPSLELPIMTPVGDAPLVQRADGWMTRRLRTSWSFSKNGGRNFPAKVREESLEHHAQDAALLAALPPHQWRDQIFIDVDRRPRRDANGKRIVNGDGKPEMEEFVIALRELAPDWRGFENTRVEPLVHILGGNRRSWRKAWRTKFANTSFWKIAVDDRSQTAFLRGEIVQFKPTWSSLDRCPDCGEPLADYKGGSKQCKKCKRKFFVSDITPWERRRTRTSSQPQGAVLQITPHDGPPRVVNVEGAADALCLVRNQEKCEIKCRLQPAIAGLVHAEFDPPLASGDEIIGELRRDEFVRLVGKRVAIELFRDTAEGRQPVYFPSAAWRFIEVTKENEEPRSAAFVFPDGFYRVKEISRRQRSAEVWHESIADGVQGESWCSPALGRSSIPHEELKAVRKQNKSLFKKFPEWKLREKAVEELLKTT